MQPPPEARGKRPSDPNIGPISRRNFMRLSGGVIGAGVAYWALGTRPVAASVLPPGAIPELLFHATCIRCGLCAQVCDQQAIEFDTEGYPQITGLQGWCDFSGDCAAICPTGALIPFDPETLQIATAVIDTDQCIAWNIRGSCQLCFRRCQTLQKAIWIDEDRRPQINPDLCNGCGACTHDCPKSSRPNQNKRFGKAVSLQALA